LLSETADAVKAQQSLQRRDNLCGSEGIVVVFGGKDMIYFYNFAGKTEKND